MPLFLSLFVAKFTRLLSRLTGRGGGSALPGLVAEKLDPNILGKFADHLPGGIILVTGTNGKTTATKMLTAILESKGHRVVSNRSGSNLTRGIVSSLTEQASLTGKLPGDVGLFEVDEATMPAACQQLQPHVILVLNLFRDQLDRYGELDKTASLIGRGIESTQAEVWLNADDPLVASLAKYSQSDRVHFFGVEHSDTQKLTHDVAADSDHCPVCGQALDYSAAFFSHLGHYSCSQGHFGRSKPEVALSQVGEKLTIAGQPARLALPGLYNAYNALAAAAAASSLGISVKDALTALERVTAAFGRVEQFERNGRKVYLLLIKNPTGFNQVIQTFLQQKTVPLLIAINDNFADGRDVSWLWDVGIEELADQAVICSGIRAYDMAVRLKYAGKRPEVETDLLKAFDRLLEQSEPGQTVYVLPTYTAMLELRNRLKLARFTA